MPSPSLPPLSPPSIPNRRASQQEPQKKKPDFFFIMAMTILIVWSFRVLTHKKENLEELASGSHPVAEAEAPAAPMALPSAEEGEERLAQLPADLTASAQTPGETKFVTLGSADSNSDYRMLVTLSTKGASVSRLELNEDRYRDCSDPTGYLGQIIGNETICADDFNAGKKGIAVQVVGAGTPAQRAGLKVGDRICSIEILSHNETGESQRVEIDSFDTLRTALFESRPGDTALLEILPASASDSDALQKVEVPLTRAPISIIRPAAPMGNYDDYVNLSGLQGAVTPDSDDFFPEGAYNLQSPARKRNSDPASFLMTLADYDESAQLAWPKVQAASGKKQPSLSRSPQLDKELPDLTYINGEWAEDPSPLRGSDWELVEAETNETQAVFRKVLLGRKLEARKIYRLEASPLPEGQKKKSTTAREYHLTLSVQWRNLDPENSHQISYFLDGPNGLPIEGAWYSSGRKTGPGWGMCGMRDIVLGLNGGRRFHLIRCREIATSQQYESESVNLDYIGVDTQYFQCTLIPKNENAQSWNGAYIPLRVGAYLEGLPIFTNTSFRVKSPKTSLSKAGTSGDVQTDQFTIFAGPKRQSILNTYGLGDTLVFGWFWFIAKPLSGVLHFLCAIVFNYGLAIILLTVIVRLLLFPLSRKQIISSLKMSKLQPQLAALREKYKDNPQAQGQAQMALFKKYKVSPAGGCLPIFLQMPVFIGLYKVLSLDVDLYGTPLISHAVRWCSNLAAPDMLIDWSGFWASHGWGAFNFGQGMFYFGPYFNLLPMLTIVLFLVQQKFMMPPPSGSPEQVAQQKSMKRMMTVMMIFFGFMFFKLPSGLCIYFVASSLWAILERRFMPKDITLSADGVIDIPSQPTSPTPQGSTKVKRDWNERQSRNEQAQKPKGFRARLAELMEKAQEQQRLAKAEAEKRARRRKR